MTDTRYKNSDWTCGEGKTISFDGAQLAVLMDIRDELRTNNQHLAALEALARCVNVQRGFIAMNRLRLHVEKHGMRPKPRKVAT